MRPILCIIDLTGSSATVLHTAVRLASAFKTHLVILSPYRLIDHEHTDNLSAFNSQLAIEATHKFNHLKQQGEIFDHISYEFRPEIGFTPDRITSFLKAGEAEMVVIGQQQASAINEVDKNALEDLIRNSKLPFTIVP